MKPDGRRVCAGGTIGGRRAELRQRGPMIAPASDLGSETLDRDASIPLYLQLAVLVRFGGGVRAVGGGSARRALTGRGLMTVVGGKLSLAGPSRGAGLAAS